MEDPEAAFDRLGERRVVRLVQGRVAYHDRGDGPVLVFLHGLYLDGRTWRHVVPRLAGRYRCITPHLPLGAHPIPLEPDADVSPGGIVDLLLDLLRELDLEDVTIVANDTSTALAQMLMVRRPARVARVVLSTGDAYRNFLAYGIKWQRIAAFLPAAFWLVCRLWSSPVGRWGAWLVLTKRLPSSRLRWDWSRPPVESRGVRRDLAKFMRGATPRHTIRAARRLGAFDRPVLLAWTRPFPDVFPYRHARKLAERLPDARLEVIDDSFAFVQEDQPERMAELISGFVPQPAAE